MHIEELRIKNFRNISEILIEPHEKYNLVFGGNAQGKTSVLEAVWMMSGCKSFRTSREYTIVNHRQQYYEISMKCRDGLDERRAPELYCRSNGRDRLITVNKVRMDTQGLFNNLKCILFTPSDIEIVRGAPETRRHLVDLCHSQVAPNYIKSVSAFNAVLKQRNAALKSVAAGEGTRGLVEAFDGQYAFLCCMISMGRNEYIAKLNEHAGEIYSKISRGKEKLSVVYSPDCFSAADVNALAPDNLTAAAEQFRAEVSANYATELKYGHSQVGAHKDDMKISIDGYSLKEFGSQGQQKSAALALKLAQAHIFQTGNREKPVILLDDVMGELDAERRDVIYKIVEDMQVFITTCNEENFRDFDGARVFRIADGGLTNN